MLERTCTVSPQTSVGGNTAGEGRVFSGHQQTQPARSVGCAVGVRQASDGDVDKQRKTGSQIGLLKRCHMALTGHINMTLYLGIKLGAWHTRDQQSPSLTTQRAPLLAGHSLPPLF